MLSSLLAFGLMSAAGSPSPGALLRVVDTGAGLCCVARLPGETGPRYFVYDAGNYEDRQVAQKIAEVIPPGSTIDLLVLSHSDADHAAAVRQICRDYRVGVAIRPDIARTTRTWRSAVEALGLEARTDGCRVLYPGDSGARPGSTWQIGDGEVRFVCGFSEPPREWDLRGDSERYNAGSVVMRLEYAGRSVLLCGDAVGRHIGDPEETCLNAERLMVDRAVEAPIDSDAIVAPHHGADNGSSLEFIRAVSPEYVVFSAGHKHRHPRRQTARRYARAGVSYQRMLRTDRGDDEGGDEWSYRRVRGHVDPIGDDDVDIRIGPAGELSVAYRR